MRVSRMGVVLMGTLFVGNVPPPAVASPALLAKAKEKGYPAQNCQYCHVSRMPAAASFNPDDLNERGKFLLEEKNKDKAGTVDVDALKAYPGGKAQK